MMSATIVRKGKEEEEIDVSVSRRKIPQGVEPSKPIVAPKVKGKIIVDISDSPYDPQLHEVSAFLVFVEEGKSEDDLEYFCLDSFGESEDGWTPAESLAYTDLEDIQEWLDVWKRRAEILHSDYEVSPLVLELVEDLKKNP